MCLIVMLHIAYNVKIIAYVLVKWARDNAVANWLCAREDLEWSDGIIPAHEDTDYIDGKDRISLKRKWIDGHTMLTSQSYLLVR